MPADGWFFTPKSRHQGRERLGKQRREIMVTRRDLLKMGILGSSGFVTLPSGGGFGRVSRFFDHNNGGSSPRLTPFVDELPGTGSSPFQTLTNVDAFSNAQDYAQPFCGPRTPHYVIAGLERNVKFHLHVA